MEKVLPANLDEPGRLYFFVSNVPVVEGPRRQASNL
jgi:hypothetical protein